MDRADVAELFFTAEDLHPRDADLAALHVVEIADEVDTLGRVLAARPEDAGSFTPSSA